MISPPETDDPIDISLEARVGGRPRSVRRAQVLIRWLVVAACAVGLLVAWRLAGAATLEGRVVGVADSDTITVLDSAKTQHRVRLAGIDAPEKKQAFGNRSRENLARWVHRRDVTVEWHKKDRYAIPLLRELRVAHTHKNAVKDVVRGSWSARPSPSRRESRFASTR